MNYLDPRRGELVTWEVRKERCPNDYGPRESGERCPRCYEKFNQFNHTDANCRKHGWDGKPIKEREISSEEWNEWMNEIEDLQNQGIEIIY